MSQATLQIIRQATRDGQIALMARADALASTERPLVLMLHGALRHAGVLFPWLFLLEPDFDVAFIDLPGHGNSPTLFPVTVENFAANIGDVLNAALSHRQVILVGESLGGLVALAMGGLGLPMVRGVLAADPPLTTGKLWHVALALRDHVLKNSEPFWSDFAFNIFGVGGGEIDSRDRIYYPLLEKMRVPAAIVTGDVPLFPPRHTPSVPCVMDAVDRYIIERQPAGRLQLHTIENTGHVLLVDAMPRCAHLLREFYSGV